MSFPAPWIWTASLLALIIIAGLVFYAWRLWRQIAQQDASTNARRAATRADQIQSVRILADSLLRGDLNLTEGAIRIKVMLDYLLPEQLARAQYGPFYALYDATEHMPRRNQRDAYSRAELERFDTERQALENQHRAAVLEAARRVKEHPF